MVVRGPTVHQHLGSKCTFVFPRRNWSSGKAIFSKMTAAAFSGLIGSWTKLGHRILYLCFGSRCRSTMERETTKGMVWGFGLAQVMRTCMGLKCGQRISFGVLWSYTRMRRVLEVVVFIIVNSKSSPIRGVVRFCLIPIGIHQLFTKRGIGHVCIHRLWDIQLQKGNWERGPCPVCVHATGDP